jgi:hypothetical protein
MILGMLIIEDGIRPQVPPEHTGQGASAIGLVTGMPLRKNIRRIMINCQSYEGQCSSIIIESVV